MVATKHLATLSVKEKLLGKDQRDVPVTSELLRTVEGLSRLVGAREDLQRQRRSTEGRGR